MQKHSTRFCHAMVIGKNTWPTGGWNVWRFNFCLLAVEPYWPSCISLSDHKMSKCSWLCGWYDKSHCISQVSDPGPSRPYCLVMVSKFQKSFRRVYSFKMLSAMPNYLNSINLYINFSIYKNMYVVYLYQPSTVTPKTLVWILIESVFYLSYN